MALLSLHFPPNAGPSTLWMLLLPSETMYCLAACVSALCQGAQDITRITDTRLRFLFRNSFYPSLLGMYFNLVLNLSIYQL